MKKVLMVLMVALFAAIGAQAQTEVKVKKTSTPGQKMHNVFSRHKHHKGYKIKRKVNGHKVKRTVEYHGRRREVKTEVKKN